MPVEMHRDVIERELDQAAEKWAHRVGRRVTTAAKKIVSADGHVDSGRMRAAIDYAVDRTGPTTKRVIVGCSVDYAKYFHTGTGIHGPAGRPIVPLRPLNPAGRPSALKFTPKGSKDAIFRRSVAGMKPDPFLTKALVEVLGDTGTIREL
jgi:hypothetical protein